MLLLATELCVFGEIHVILQLSSIGFFETNRAYHHLEKPRLHEVFLSKAKYTLRGNQCAGCYSL
jgi:hypothetical protein